MHTSSLNLVRSHRSSLRLGHRKRLFLIRRHGRHRQGHSAVVFGNRRRAHGRDRRLVGVVVVGRLVVLLVDCIRNARAACVRRSSTSSGSGERNSGLLVRVLAGGYRVGRWEFRRDVRLALLLLLLLVLLFILLLRGLGLLVLLILLFLGFSMPLRTCLSLLKALGAVCDRRLADATGKGH